MEHFSEMFLAFVLKEKSTGSRACEKNPHFPHSERSGKSLFDFNPMKEEFSPKYVPRNDGFLFFPRAVQPVGF
jgi:hypothetical protein